MARNTVQHHSGFTFNYTDLNQNVFPPKDGCVADSMAWEDLDGDGCIDFACIGTASGDYEDTDHEVVGIHVPSGNRLWTALRGEASKKLGLCGGVLVVSTNSGNRLRGLDPRTGRQMWEIGLEDALKEDTFDSDDSAPAIASVGGPWAAFECVDETAHVIDARTGQLVKSVTSGELRAHGWNLPGLIAFKTENDEGDEIVDVWDLQAGRSLYRMKESGSRAIHGGGYFGFMHGGETPKGDWATQVVIFDAQTRQQVGTTWLKAAGGGDVNYESARWGHTCAFLLGGRLVFGDPYSEEGSAWTAPLDWNRVSAAEPWNPPKPGYVLRALGWCSPVLASVWQKAKGTERLVACGHDPNSLQTLWTAEDLGGSHHHDNPLHVAGHAVLVPRASDNYYSPTNPAALVHLDPASGQRVTEYPVEATDCVALAYHFLVGCPDYFSGGVPVAYDTWNRVRLL